MSLNRGCLTFLLILKDKCVSDYQWPGFGLHVKFAYINTYLKTFNASSVFVADSFYFSYWFFFYINSCISNRMIKIRNIYHIYAAWQFYSELRINQQPSQPTHIHNRTSGPTPKPSRGVWHWIAKWLAEPDKTDAVKSERFFFILLFLIFQHGGASDVRSLRFSETIWSYSIKTKSLMRLYCIF